MKKIIKINGNYGSKIGNIQVFTYKGAEEAYRKFLQVCYKDFTYEAFEVLLSVEEDMLRIGYNREQLEKIEFEYLESIA